MVKTKLCRGEDKGENPAPRSRKNRSERIGAKNKNKKSRLHGGKTEIRAYTLRCNVAWPQAAYPFNPNQNKALLAFRSHQKTRKGKRGKFPILA